MIKYYRSCVAIIIIFAVILAISSEWNDSIIVDEVPHIGAGYSYLEKNDMRLNPEHPPLAKDLAAIPLIFLNLKNTAFSSKFWLNDINGQWEFGRLLIFNSGNDADLIRHAAKIPMILFFILSAFLTAKWARRLYGDIAGLLALFLFSLSPTVLAHSRFVTTDAPALFGVLIASYFFIKYLRKPTKLNLFVAGLIFGVALLTKFSTFLLAPFLGLIAVIYGFVQIKNRFSIKFLSAIKYGLISVLIFLIGLLFVVWPIYYFHTFNYPIQRQHYDTKVLLSSFGNRYMADPVVWMSDKPVIRALGQYGLGLLMVVQRSAGGNTTFFLGETMRNGWHHYFPVVYLIKEPLAWWAFVLVAVISIFSGIKKSKIKNRKLTHRLRNLGNWLEGHLEEFAMLTWLVIYWASSIQSNLNIGIRHMLPTYPFAIILVSGQIARILENAGKPAVNAGKHALYSVAVPGLFAILLGWYFYENTKIYPYYLTYFNQLAGGASNGHKFVVDSNLDWGQDLVRLSKYVKENNIPRLELDYFGWADPYYYLKDKYIWMSSTKYLNAQDFAIRNQSQGWLAVSATFLQGSEGTPEEPHQINYKNWLHAIEPVTVIGNSIFVYHIE